MTTGDTARPASGPSMPGTSSTDSPRPSPSAPSARAGIDHAARASALVGRAWSVARTVRSSAQFGARTGSGRLDELYRLIEDLAGAVADLAGALEESR